MRGVRQVPANEPGMESEQQLGAHRRRSRDRRAATRDLTTAPADVNVYYIYKRGHAMALVLTVLGFMWWWPLGLLILGFLIARGKFACWRHPIYTWDGTMRDWEHGGDRWERKMARMQEKMERMRARMDRVRSPGDWFGPTSSGNRAFDEYRSETLKRLEEEQREFKEFLARLRFAKDRAVDLVPFTALCRSDSGSERTVRRTARADRG
jgi:Protein of unknown function (DUF2852)